jgi:hypothetical protein
VADFLTNLVGRAAGLSPKLRPVVPPLFAEEEGAGEVAPAVEPEGARSLLPTEAAPVRPAAPQAAENDVRANASPRAGSFQPGPPRDVEPAEDGESAGLQDERRQPPTVRLRRATPVLEPEAARPPDELAGRAELPDLRSRESIRRVGATGRPPSTTEMAAQVDEEQLLMPLSRPQRAAEVRAAAMPEVQSDLPANDEGRRTSRARVSVRVEPSEPTNLDRRVNRGKPFAPMAPDAGADRGRALLRDEPPGAAGPTIEITIGRVEVRAVRPPEARQPAPKPAAPRPRLSLEDYLASQRRGRP